MRRLFSLLLALPLAGCVAASRPPVDAPGPGSSPAPRSLRVATSDGELRHALASTASPPPVVVTDGRCVRLEFADATAAARRQESWQRALSRGTADAWLLSDLEGADAFRDGTAADLPGLTRDDRVLRACRTADSSRRDLERRLSHPALAAAPPVPDRVVLHTTSDAFAALRLGDVDAAVAGEATAAAAREAGLVVEEWPGLSRVWTIAVRPGGRWLGDPTLRRWLRARLERGVDGPTVGLDGARSCRTLDCRGAPPESLPAPDRPPLSPGAAPRLEILFVETEPVANAIAARVVGLLLDDGWAARRAGLTRSGLSARLRQGRFDLAVWDHRAWVGDPLLDAEWTDRRLGPAGRPSRTVLEQAARWDDPDRRAASLRAAQRTRRDAASVVPLLEERRFLLLRPGVPVPCRLGPGPRIAWDGCAR